ncbi:hypothetical protein [Burkholderia ubonensis]|uniref:hypothetical protein n=1 Tax=Burkholderia ubonensis TaxID=101571 RepID=UPI00075C35F0|nr:hypothetical protein [Burkholderia ubonensis]KWK82682.1 polysaccharide deacetylase [Burkholderia ubonensis]KWK93506.1 polysaccharide deacetylase [Burkholderia ubonensis]
MIGVFFSQGADQAGRHVLAAVRRSVSEVQAEAVSASALRSVRGTLVVADAPDSIGDALICWLHERPRKLVVFGRMPSTLAALLDYRRDALPPGWRDMGRSEPAPPNASRESRANVQYTARAAALNVRSWNRPFERFDFTDEWNNLGFGAIRMDGSIWALAERVDVPREAELAAVQIGDERCGSYAALWDDVGGSSVLWFNRAVGPCDSFEWRIVENFLSGYGAQRLPCHPVLSEIPWGADAAITSRLDCDEDVESARALWQRYRTLDVPFSLAVHTMTLDNPVHHAILRELHEAGGAVLSHSATHAPNWGGSYDAALREAVVSASSLLRVTGAVPRYAVSPFHQTPAYALQALADAGYEGCIGGIIRNDPEFLLARGGLLDVLPLGFVGHSQQCMLHGACMLADGDPLAVYKQAFILAHETKALFGYLDHPFSSRYSYGWSDEETRGAMHERLVEFIRCVAAAPVFMTEEEAMDFLQYKSRTQVIADGGTLRAWTRASRPSLHTLCVEFRGEHMPIEPMVEA